MADGTQDQVSDGSSTEGPGTHGPHDNVRHADGPDLSGPDLSDSEADARDPRADTGRVARIVAALRKAHAEQAAANANADAVAPDVPAVRRETTGVRPAPPSTPSLRWNPGARYRASRLASQPAAHQPTTQGPPAPSVSPAQTPPVPAPPVPAPPAPASSAPAPAGAADAPTPQPTGPLTGHGPVPPPPVPAPPALAGRLFRGPARRTAVFEREIWHPVARSSRPSRDVSEALVAAVERYRQGSISTSGLVRAIGRAHAA
ncbi:hypothetical protein C8K30_106279 [Promicromonospora sp. AC04]|uniref:hypothetical protein n=1 Tax=Promicromonospora sp. AC04 TaxID=2135723 RepID=UPI000D4F8FB4|nr:hypothetical protein [Promicromonospora sp. AC04]PUB26190.1 hypothetical protein C8K30_106279 [Promicromonospora sp. AC04]